MTFALGLRQRTEFKQIEIRERHGKVRDSKRQSVIEELI